MTGSRAGAWADQDEEKVRPYVLTGGRTRPRHSMRLVSLLEARGTAPPGLAPEAGQAVRLCRDRPRSVAEIAAAIGQPACITKIILSNLIDAGLVMLVVPRTVDDPMQLLEALRAGLQRRFSDVA
ncbi:DUF742 domain-containing protein [Actinomadura fulvescens]|uniref:DUF742 domain-containing protein n=1 Tax=Actinomadura fulvescens TaxID=46160 RepID=A0ABN3QHW1_9ACTN